MHPRFAAMADSLHPSFERLMAMKPIVDGVLPRSMPLSGIYLFSEGDRHLYVGRSNNMRSRYSRHCRPGATHRMAAFAFRLAREATGNMVATYKKGEGSRDGLMLTPTFLDAFTSAKSRIRLMHYRYVEESEQTRQALLEIYASVALGTPYNDFNTH